MPSHDLKTLRVCNYILLHTYSYMYVPTTSTISNTVQGGGVVRLFHRESECYISAEGSFALSDDIEDGILFIVWLW